MSNLTDKATKLIMRTSVMHGWGELPRLSLLIRLRLRQQRHKWVVDFG